MTDEEFEQQNEYEDGLQERINELEEENKNKSELGLALYTALVKELEKQGLTNDIPSVIDQLVGKNCGEYANMYNEYKNQKKELAHYKKLGLALAYERCPKCNKEMIYNSKYNFYRCCSCGLVIDGVMFDYYLQQVKEKVDEQKASEKERED